MKWKSKKAFTLVEMIVSIAIIALVSIALLGFILPAANQQQTAEVRNKSVNNTSDQLEKKVYSLTPGNTDYTTSGFITGESYTLTLQINGVNIPCTGTLYHSKDAGNGVEMREFVPASQ